MACCCVARVASRGNGAYLPLLKCLGSRNSPVESFLVKQKPTQKAALIRNILYSNMFYKWPKEELFLCFNPCCSSSSELSNGHGAFRASKQKNWDKGLRCRISCCNLDQTPLSAASLKISQLCYHTQPSWWPVSRLSFSKTNKPSSSHTKSLALQLTYLTTELLRGMFHLLLLQ